MQRWLEIHERQTAGIPGLLALVLNLPIRSTISVHADILVKEDFKNAHGWLRGWTLPPEEEERRIPIQGPEVVRRQRPMSLWIEVRTATSKMPEVIEKCNFDLRLASKQWTVDQASRMKIIRHGFPIVPDFGGTPHANCGSILDAEIEDVLG